MPLTVVTGRANTGKTGVLHDVLVRAVDAGEFPVLLLPTMPDVKRAREWLSAERVLGVQIDQFERYVEGLWAIHGDGRRMVGNVRRAALLRAVSLHSASTVGPSARTPGFVRMAARVARRLSEEPPWLLEQAEAASATDEAVLCVVRAYLDRLEGEGLVEPGAAARYLADHAPAPRGPLLAHDFSDLGAAQEALLLSWADSGTDVWVTLPWERGFPATAALDVLAERMFARADEVVPCHPPEAPDTHPELTRMEAGLFASPEVRPGGGAVTFCTAVGAEAEAALIARHAARLAEEAEDPDRVAIVFRDAARHVGPLRAALAAAGVSADFDVRLPLDRTPFGLALGRLLRFRLSGERAELAAFLRSPFSGADAYQVDRLERRWRMAREVDAARLAAAARDLCSEVARALTLSRGLCEEGGLTSRSAAGWKSLADAFLSTAHGPEGLQTDPDAAVDVAAHRALLETVEEVAESGGLNASDLLEALGDVMTTPGESERPGHVQVTEAHRLRARRFDAIIVGGMTAGDFSAENAASPANDLVDRLLCIEEGSEQARERMLFYNVVTRARRRLVFVRRKATAEGDPVRPSVFWEEVLDLYRRPDADEEGDTSRDGVALETLGIADLEETAPASRPRRAVLRRLASAHDGSTDERVAHVLERVGASRGELRDPEMRARLAARQVFSATELERYAQCPYGWFYERIVRPRTIDAEIGPREKGDLAHRVLRRVYEELPARTGRRRVTPETLEAALGLADEVFAEESVPPKTARCLTLSEEDGLASVLHRVRDLLAADQDFLRGYEPVAVEMSFGPAEEGAMDLGGFALQGRIDRIDAGEPGVAVVDYKSGEAPKLSDFGPRRILQLPLYAAVAERLMERPVVAGFYRSVRDGAARGFFLADAVDASAFVRNDRLESPEALREVVSSALAAARAAAEGIRAGAIAPHDPAPGACEHCAAAPFCPGRS